MRIEDKLCPWILRQVLINLLIVSNWGSSYININVKYNTVIVEY